MKERRGGGESLFSFRRSNNRYSLHLDKPTKKESDVTLKRASWSSFPLLRFSSPEEKNACKERLQSKSQSNEEIKNSLNGNTRGIAAPMVSQKIGCNFLRGSTASIRSAFSSNSASSSSSSCSGSSTSSSPTSRSAASTGNSSITSILEGSGCDSQYGSSSTLEDSLPYLPAAASVSSHTTIGPLTTRSTSDVIELLHHNHNPLAYLTSSRGTSSVSSLLEEEEEKEGEIKDKPTTAPKILYAHKKTPDLKRKTRKQLVKDIEFIKTHGVVPEHIEDLTVKPITLKYNEEKENIIPLANNTTNKKVQQKPKSNFKFMQNYRFLSKMDTKKKSVTPPESDSGTYDSGTHSPSSDMWPSASIDTTSDMSDESRRSSRASPVSVDKNRLSPVSCDSQSLSDLEIHNDILTTLRRDTNGFINGKTDVHSRLGLSEPIIGDFSSLFDRQLHKFKVFGEIIEEEEGSECDLSEFMVHAEESNRFERSIEQSLEMLGERDSVERDSMERDSVERDFGMDLESNLSEHGETTKSSNEQSSSKCQDESRSTFVSKVNLKLDLSSINQSSPPSQDFRRYLLRHISEEHVNSLDEQAELRSTASSPSTPRSPAIDIDDVFKQKQKEIVDGSKGDMLRVRDLAQRLKLSTRRPSYVDWLGSIKAKNKAGKEALECKHPISSSSEKDNAEEELTDEKRKENLNSAMCWLRKELNEMRVQDQQLARQLMQLRLELQRLRLLRSCSHHQALVEEVANEAQEQKFFEVSDIYDVYEESPDLRETFSPVLREIGVTKMNITSRRFSLRS
ncbi:unnamed protein product, partial [Meganyctiphanes norvegica]